MTTATQARTTKAQAKGTARSATATAKSATRDAKRTTTRTTRPARREARRTEQGVVRHTRRVVEAAQAEVTAVARTPYRPALFALGLLDRTVAGVKELPATVTSSPTRTRERIVSVFATAGDLAERAQQGYTEVAKDGEKFVRSVRRLDSAQRAERLAERAGRRGKGAVRDTGKAVEAGADAAAQALGKLG